MFILGDEGHYHGRFPWVTAALVAINILVFSLQCALGERFTNGFSLVPAEITEFRDITRTEYHTAKVRLESFRDRQGHVQYRYGETRIPIHHYPGPFPIVLTLFTSMFLHGGIIHLIGNMWFLLVFGRNVECALGHGRFVFFYSLCGAAGGLAHVATDPHSVIPCLGASGAISGVMGAYVAIHPLNKIKVWFGFWLGVWEVPALAVIGIWFLFQYLAAGFAQESGVSDGVAYWCHIGGFLTGLCFIWALTAYLHYQVLRGRAATEDIPTADAMAAQAADDAGRDPVPAEAALPDPFKMFMPPPAPLPPPEHHDKVKAAK